MGKFYNALITTTDPELRASSISNFFNNISGITSTVIDYEYNEVEYYAADIRIDSTNINAVFGINKSSAEATVEKLMLGSETIISDKARDDQYIAGSGGIVVSAYVDDNCVVIYINRPSDQYHLDTSGNCIEVMSVTTSDYKYLMGYYSTAIMTFANLVDISLMTFENVNDLARIHNTYANMFQYTADFGSIDFLGQAYFKNGNGYKSFTTEVLRECSTIDILGTASLSDGNWIALGAHCLAPLDDEEDN